jgi:hypothetical protein
LLSLHLFSFFFSFFSFLLCMLMFRGMPSFWIKETLRDLPLDLGEMLRDRPTLLLTGRGCGLRVPCIEPPKGLLSRSGCLRTGVPGELPLLLGGEMLRDRPTSLITGRGCGLRVPCIEPPKGLLSRSGCLRTGVPGELPLLLSCHSCSLTGSLSVSNAQ